ncbi:MAG TPA: hypothetical protein VN641_10180 [Urbifossiella sp.]|nr:hypothetical protein [Urbifossiella sp.]
MGDCIIDTNVLLVASAHYPTGQFKDSNLPIHHMQLVFDWLLEFRKNPQCVIVLDHKFRIWSEYNNKMTGQDLGLMVVIEKMQMGRFVEIEFDQNDHGLLPAELEQVIHDLSDRKFVAVALADAGQGITSRIVNAADSDWCSWGPALARAGVAVEHLIDGFCEEHGTQKTAVPTKRRAKSKS